jgi:hypothetical protein
LLASWKDVPGCQNGQTVDEDELLRWIQEARALAKQRGLLEVCDSRIGEVLAHAPGEADGSWPCIPVRDVLEEISADSDKILRGWGGGLINKRGPYWKSFGEGGAQDQELAKTYRAFAEASQNDWPRTAVALRRVAQFYEDEARREDAQAMLDG